MLISYRTAPSASILGNASPTGACPQLADQAKDMEGGTGPDTASDVLAQTFVKLLNCQEFCKPTDIILA